MTVVYRPTYGDRLWLLRAVETEGAPYAVVACALVNRFLWLAQRDPRPYTTLGEYVRAYAAPVNPRRMRGGKIWERLWREADEAGRQELSEADMRRRKNCARVEFSSHTYLAVDQALLVGDGVLSDTSITDYAAHWLQQPKHLELVREGQRGTNALYRVQGNEHWRGYEVHYSEPTIQRSTAMDDGLRAVATVELRTRETLGGQA